MQLQAVMQSNPKRARKKKTDAVQPAIASTNAEDSQEAIWEVDSDSDLEVTDSSTATPSNQGHVFLHHD